MNKWRLVRSNTGWAAVNVTTRMEVHMPEASYEFADRLLDYLNGNGATVKYESVPIPVDYEVRDTTCCMCNNPAVYCAECASDLDAKEKLETMNSNDPSLQFVMINIGRLEGV